MKVRTGLFALAAIGFSLSAMAQEPVVGVKDPESLFKDSDPKINRNKQARLIAVLSRLSSARTSLARLRSRSP